MSSRIVGCILACFVFALSLGGCTAGDRQAEVGGDSGFQLINSANVYEGSLSLEYRMGDPGGETSLDISLVDCALSKDVPSVIPGGYIDVDKKLSDQLGYSLGDASELSVGFEYATIRLEIENPSDKNMLMNYGFGSIISMIEDTADLSAEASRRPVWYDWGIGKEGGKDYLIGTIEPHETQDVVFVYIVSEKILQSDKGTYLLLDGGVDRKAFRLDFDKGAS